MSSISRTAEAVAGNPPDSCSQDSKPSNESNPLAGSSHESSLRRGGTDGGQTDGQTTSGEPDQQATLSLFWMAGGEIGTMAATTHGATESQKSFSSLYTLSQYIPHGHETCVSATQ